jgi:hypothetical protein
VKIYSESVRGTSPLDRIAADYLGSCFARGLAPRTVDKVYGYPLLAIFLPWCNEEGITSLAQLDRKALDRFTAALLLHRKVNGKPLSKYSVHSYVRPVRQMLTWAAQVGEEVKRSHSCLSGPSRCAMC